MLTVQPSRDDALLRRAHGAAGASVEPDRSEASRRTDQGPLTCHEPLHEWDVTAPPEAAVAAFWEDIESSLATEMKQLALEGSQTVKQVKQAVYEAMAPTPLSDVLSRDPRQCFAALWRLRKAMEPHVAESSMSNMISGAYGYATLVHDLIDKVPSLW